MSVKKISGLGLLAGAAMLAGLAAAPAHAQGVPGGSYMASCNDVRMHGDKLIANCRRTDGSWARTGVDVNRCAGGIANTDGNLTCNQTRTSGWSRDSGEGYGSSYERPHGGYERPYEGYRAYDRPSGYDRSYGGYWGR